MQGRCRRTQSRERSPARTTARGQACTRAGIRHIPRWTAARVKPAPPATAAGVFLSTPPGPPWSLALAPSGPTQSVLRATAPVAALSRRDRQRC
eukprot:scaffold62477_cov53-Phaeocystis_antarctica.AAC.3